MFEFNIHLLSKKQMHGNKDSKPILHLPYLVVNLFFAKLFLCFWLLSRWIGTTSPNNICIIIPHVHVRAGDYVIGIVHLYTCKFMTQTRKVFLDKAVVELVYIFD